MLFHFTLLPLEDCQPWQHPEKGPYLHWFGLTEGEYWIEAGRDTLLEYGPELRGISGTGRHCEYAVGRLHEDLLAMLPSVLEPVPDPLVRCLSRNALWDLWTRAKGRYEDEYEDAARWALDRYLDTAYLTPSAEIFLWSDPSSVHIAWDHRKKTIDGAPAWTAVHGSFQLSREEFVDEVRSFHERLIDQMAERIERVSAGALPPGVRVDLPVLAGEQERRRKLIDRAPGETEPSTDWGAAGAALEAIERDAAV